jgi:thioredoxin reductase (NADPH)
MSSNRYDLAIVGAGVTGLAAAMYAARLNLKTLLVGNAGSESAALDVGGTITLTDVVENYPGFQRLTGQELAEKLHEQTRSYPLVDIKNAWVASVDRGEHCFFLHVGEEVYQASTLLFATGTRHRELKVPGHDEFRNKGVHYCALCDGPLYQGKIVAVAGGSDSAAKEALVLAEHAARVFLIARGPELKAEPINRSRVSAHPNITVVPGTNVVAIEGASRVNRVMLDKPHEGATSLALDGLFVAIGVIPLSDLAKPLGVALTAKAEIIADRNSRTNVPGVYAAGDVGDRPFKQAITGVAEGVVAAYSAFEDLKGDLVCACSDDEAHPIQHPLPVPIETASPTSP